MYEQLVDLISNIGFPIAMAIYMTTHNSKIVEKNTEMVKELKNVIERLMDKIS